MQALQRLEQDMQRYGDLLASRAQSSQVTRYHGFATKPSLLV